VPKSHQYTKTFSCILVRVFVVKTYHLSSIWSCTQPESRKSAQYAVKPLISAQGDSGGTGVGHNTYRITLRVTHACIKNPAFQPISACFHSFYKSLAFLVK
jgi:hypothetical protein